MSRKKHNIGDLVAVSDDGIKYTIGWITKINSGVHYTVQWADEEEEYPMNYIGTNIEQMHKTYMDYLKHHIA